MSEQGSVSGAARLRASALKLLTPQTLLASILFLAGVYSYSLTLGVPPPQLPPLPPETSSTAPTATLEPQQVALVFVTPEGLERTVFQTLELPAVPNRALEGIVAALREGLLETGVWPEALGVPTVFLTERPNRERVAVLDFSMSEPVEVSVQGEMNLLKALRFTLQRNGSDSLRILINGQPAPTFLGHIALEGTLE